MALAPSQYDNGTTNNSQYTRHYINQNAVGINAPSTIQQIPPPISQQNIGLLKMITNDKYYFTPEQLNNCPPDEPIGYGAFGIVWSVTDPRTLQRVALKRMTNIFQNLASCKRTFREIQMLSCFQHDNVLGLHDILQPNDKKLFQEIHILTELMQSDLHKIIVSQQPLTTEHIKVFLYQTLRGMKYLHSANILHRDIKPGNLLINSNCVLKICDFGLARLWDYRDNETMTHEVVTQYYRAPELLMGAKRYTSAIDMWSIGCIFAEMLGRRILFQAQGPIDQLNMIIEMLGTPPTEGMMTACEGARNHVLRSPYRPPRQDRFYHISQNMTQDCVHLLSCMLEFDPSKRIDVETALHHPYLHDGRLRFHNSMCTCCHTAPNRERVYAKVLDPVHSCPLDPKWEKEISSLSMFELRDKLYTCVTQRSQRNGVPLTLNPLSPRYNEFIEQS
ncbi:Nemo-like kinase [Strongyloides ratti]|uniref:Mitogen-activated protein kinase n=1 Tax=Strongyloides ratti TaxID=34506 RepID=A0A090LE01_STRRB|nr:Nemo-like kinase [Strongyloides ratti]CEF66373.1 Nemo-like kinase [Strongyloides ratti]